MDEGMFFFIPLTVLLTWFICTDLPELTGFVPPSCKDKWERVTYYELDAWGTYGPTQANICVVASEPVEKK